MKKLFLFACVISLLPCTGCLFPGHRGGWHDGRADVEEQNAPADDEMTTPVLMPEPDVSVVW
jgi:hypothetical protein